MPTANDILLDWSISHAVYLQRYGAGVVQRIIGLLNRADADIIRLIQSQDPEIDRVRLEQMVEQIRALNATIVSRMADTLNAELQDLAAAEIASQTEALTEAMPAAVRANLAIVAPAPIQVWAAVQAQPFSGALLSETYQGFDASRQRRLREAIRQSFVQGESIDQIVRRIRGTRAAQYQDGILSLSYRDAEAIARTAIAHVAGVARDETYQANSDVIKALIWTSTIDGRTSTWCRPRDGLHYTLDHKPIGHKFPWGAGPGRIHWRCRSTSTPVLKSWRELGFDHDELPGSSRASMDGQIPEETTYAQWLRGKGFDFVADVLGVDKARLFLNGQLPLDRFYDRRGNELTLDQIRQREREAWKRAGLSEAA